MAARITSLCLCFAQLLGGTEMYGLCAREYGRPNTSTKTDIEILLYHDMRQAVLLLGYPLSIADEVAATIRSWQEGSPVGLAALYMDLDQARTGSQTRPSPRLTHTEQVAATHIASLLAARLSKSEDVFELDQVATSAKANCLGVTQLFWAIGRTLGLEVIPIEVLEMQEPGPLPVGYAHVSCMVRRSDSRLVMLDSGSTVELSRPFRLEQIFRPDGLGWQLKDPGNHLRLYRQFRPLTQAGIAAYVYNNRAVTLAQLGNYAEAAGMYQKAICLDPNSSYAHNNLGIAYRNLGKIHQALEHYTRAIELNPRYAEAFNNRAVAYCNIRMYRQAVEDCNRAIALQPRFAQAYCNRGSIHAKMGLYKAAILDYSRAVREDPHMAQAYGSRAIVHALLGNRQAASMDLAKALRLQPSLEKRLAPVSRHLALGLTR